MRDQADDVKGSVIKLITLEIGHKGLWLFLDFARRSRFKGNRGDEWCEILDNNHSLIQRQT